MYAALKKQNDIRQWLRGMGLRWRRTIFRCYREWWEMGKGVPASRRSAFDFHAVKRDIEDIDAPAIEQPEREPAACPDTPDAPEPQPVACPDTSESVEEVEAPAQSSS